MHTAFRFMIPLLAAGILVISSDLRAQTPVGTRFGAGFSIGEPTAVTMKFRVGRSSGIDFGIGRSALGYPRLHSDYIWQFTNLFSEPWDNLYAGVGAVIGFGSKGRFFLFNTNARSDRWYNTEDVVFAGRGLIGYDHFLRYTPIEFFAELAPILGFFPKTGLALEFSIGTRFYFK